MNAILEKFATADYLWVATVFFMLVSGSILAWMRVYAEKQEFLLSVKEEMIVIASASVLYSSCFAFTLIFLRGTQLPFFFWDLPILKKTTSISLLVFVYLATESLPRRLFQQEKLISSKSYNSKSTGSSVREGSNLFPGFLPVMVEVLYFAFTKTLLGYNPARTMSDSLVHFVTTVVVFTKDKKAIVLTVSASLEIKDAADFDRARGDASPDEKLGRRAPVIDSVKQGLATHLYAYAQEKEFDDIFRDTAKDMLQSLGSFVQKPIHGLKFTKIEAPFARFGNPELEKIYQSFAGRDLRARDVTAKQGEVKELYDIMKKDDPLCTMDDALRAWETFNKDSTNNFRFRFP